MGAHRLLLKGIPPFEEVYRVPLIMKGPGLPQGRISADVVSTMDLAPTLVELLLGKDFPCQGRSLVPRLNDEADWEQEAFAECHGVRFNYTQRILWRDRYKYIFNGFDEDELYDLEADPHEIRNLAKDPSSGPLAEEMATRMWEIITETGDFNLYQSHYGMYRYAPVALSWLPRIKIHEVPWRPSLHPPQQLRGCRKIGVVSGYFEQEPFHKPLSSR